MKKKTDLIGKQFGKLVVLEEFRAPYIVPKERRRTILMLKCRCSCGYVFDALKSNVAGGKSSACIYCALSGVQINKKYGHLLVLARNLDELRTFHCKCDCGKDYIAKSRYLTDGKDPKCFSCRSPNVGKVKLTRKESTKITGLRKHEKKKQSLIGGKFAYLKVLEFSHWKQTPTRRHPFYKCKCKCGNLVLVRGEQIGKTVKSCGCLQRESAKNPKNRKFTKSQIITIRSLRASGLYLLRQIAEMFNTDMPAISAICRNKIYKNCK